MESPRPHCAQLSAARAMADNSCSPDTTKPGYLSPWELAKAYALHMVAIRMAEEWCTTPAEMLGQRLDAFIASKVVLQGGGHPSERATRKALRKCSQEGWHPRMIAPSNAGGKRVYSEEALSETARVSMDLKTARVRVTPRNVRARAWGHWGRTLSPVSP